MAVSWSRRRRLTALFATATLVVAACGGDGGGGTTAPGSPSGGGGASAPAGSAPAASAPAASAGTGSGFQCENIGGEVSVVGSWSGSEQDSFMAMVAPWEECSGAKVNYTGSRDLQAQLTTGIASGNLPDLAGLPGPGLMKEWYDQGALKPLDDVIDFATYQSETPPGFAEAGQAEDGTLVAIFTKAAVKGLIWFNPANWTGGTEFESFDAMQQAAQEAATGDTAVWCIGVESGGASGWPGTDWIEDIVLRQSGPDVYDAWVQGTQKWTSPEIKSAFETFGSALDLAAGGPTNVVATSFQTAGNGLFDDPPKCLLHHQASFITDFFKNEAGATEEDYDFFPMPDINPEFPGAVTTAGDLFGMFNDTPQARSLIQYLNTADAQQIWVERGGFISMNKNVPLEAYPDEASRRSAEILSEAAAAKFDGSDLMPGAMNDAFFRAIVRFAQNQGELDAILTELDSVQADAYSQ